MRRGIPVISDYTRDSELQIGDAVYYLSPFSRYSVRKSTIVKKGPVPTDFLKDIELTLADGTVLPYHEAFDSKEMAIAYIVDDLRCSLANHRTGLQTLLRQIAEDERLLAMFEKKQKEFINWRLVSSNLTDIDLWLTCVELKLHVWKWQSWHVKFSDFTCIVL